MAIRNALDKTLEKVISRKLLVWGTATGLAALYIGGQSVIDAIVKLKGA